MSAKPRLEDEVFALFQKLGELVGEHSLFFLIGIILLTLVGGAWLLTVLRNSRSARPPEAGTGSTVGYGILLGERPPSQEPPSPLSDSPPANWDDKRD